MLHLQLSVSVQALKPFQVLSVAAAAHARKQTLDTRLIWKLGVRIYVYNQHVFIQPEHHPDKSSVPEQD